MAAKNDTMIYIVMAVACIIIFIVVWNAQSDNYSIPDDMRSRWDGGTTVWKAGASPQTCERNYRRCMEGCSMNPSIGCPGQCVEEKDYCQEFMD